ncbi:MAG: ABC transporter permease [Deltaproteobacteria bacterium]|nr:ABC transporter permease [Deltaproteobacteria bacterium]
MRITPLDRKLLRNLYSMKSQIVAIAFVMAAGVATFVMSLSTLDSLEKTQAVYYEEHRFGDVFASLKRAPNGLKARIAAIPGVDAIDARIVAAARLTLEGFKEPITGRFVSLPETGEPALNMPYIRSGRYIDTSKDNEVLVSEAFADAHKIGAGAKISAVINGRMKEFIVTGVAISPEYTLQLAPGAVMPDFKRYAILWTAETPLSTAYDMRGSFNDLTVKLKKGASSEDVIAALDKELDRYGAFGAYARKDQISHRYLSEEFRQLKNIATVFPVVFLSVAAFLLNIVTRRLIATQREEIAILKAFGYSNIAIAAHYAKFVGVIMLIGAVFGIALGAWLGRGLSNLYMTFYHFPFLKYAITPPIGAGAVVISAIAAFTGTLFAVRAAVALPPAEAMRPEPPPTYRPTMIERVGLQKYFYQTTRMVLRHIERRPLKAALSVLGISLACGIVIMGRFFNNSVDTMMDFHFNLSDRSDMTITYFEPASVNSVYEIAALDGVKHIEPFRIIPVEIRAGHVSYKTAINGYAPDSTLSKLLNAENRPIPMPPDGVMLTNYLAEKLGVKDGDAVEVEILEGNRPKRTVIVSGLVNQYIGVAGYMNIDALNRLAEEGHVISGVNMLIDEGKQEALYAKLNAMPRIAAIGLKKEALKNFNDNMADQAMTFTLINTAFAMVIAFGVVYNTARISLSENEREMASLRVLGFTKLEISYILLGELTLITLMAIPVGFGVGYWFSYNMAELMQNDLYRIPIVLYKKSYAFAAMVVLVSACFSALIVQRRLSSLDLVAVLKAKE